MTATVSWTRFSPSSEGGPAQPQLLALGEAMLRLSVRPGDRLEDAGAFEVHVAGTEANVAYAAARVGLRSAWASALPDNPLGRRVAATLAAGGVDTTLVRWVEGGRLGLYFVELGAAPRPTTVVYDRAGSALAIAAPDVFDWPAISAPAVFHTTGITLGLSQSCRALATAGMAAARRRGATVTFDVNYRQRLWPAAAAAGAVREVAGLIDVLISTSEDARDLFGCAGPPEAMAADLSGELGIGTVVLTLGGEGAVAHAADGVHRRPGYVVETIDRVGAGDAFVAGLVWGLLDGSLEEGLERGLAMSALKMTLRGDLFRFDAADVRALLARTNREVGR